MHIRARSKYPSSEDRGDVRSAFAFHGDHLEQVFDTERLTGALLNRLTNHVNILEMNGESYRLAQSRARKSSDNT